MGQVWRIRRAAEIISASHGQNAATDVDHGPDRPLELILVRAFFAALSQQSDRSGFSVRGEIEQPVVADKGGMPADGGPLSDDREAMGVLLHGSLVASGEGVAENARA